MESLDLIREMCMKTLSCFHSTVERQYHRKLSTTYIFIPHFIRNHKDTEQSSVNRRIWCKYRFWMKYFTIFPLRKKQDLERLVHLIYDNQNEISWVDFKLLMTKENVTVYVVELVCLGKKTGTKLNYHIAWETDYFEKFDENNEGL